MSFDQQQNHPFAAFVSRTRSSISMVTPSKPTARGSKWAYAQMQRQALPFSPLAFQLPPQTSTVQVNNRMIGNAMSRLKNAIQSTICLPVLERKPLFQPREQNDGGHAANSSETNPNGSRASRLTFVEDFLLEHSAPGACITSIEISGSF